MSLIGLYRVMAPTSFIVMFSLMISPWLRSLSFPVISLRRFALLKRMVLEEVSGRPMTARTKAAPLEKRRGQRDHLHPRAWVVNEPMTGPTVRSRERERDRKTGRDRNVELTFFFWYQSHLPICPIHLQTGPAAAEAPQSPRGYTKTLNGQISPIVAPPVL